MQELSSLIEGILVLYKVWFKSLRVVFPAACGEFVIPAEAGIQKTGLDSASSAE
jgi:hypothetical protein